VPETAATQGHPDPVGPGREEPDRLGHLFLVTDPPEPFGAAVVPLPGIRGPHRAEALVDLGRATEGLADIERALALKPRHVAALRVRGLALARPFGSGKCAIGLTSRTAARNASASWSARASLPVGASSLPGGVRCLAMIDDPIAQGVQRYSIVRKPGYQTL